jgi:DNA (cytosine-5)-methyltransferase 1
MEKQIVYLDLFSGLGSFAKGLLAAGFVFKKHYFSEIDPHCIASYRHNFKNAEYVGDIQNFKTQKIDRPDIVTFGSPCQDLSLAGKREGLKGRKSNLFFKAVEIIKRYRPRVFVFENVAGLFSSNQGKDFEVVLQTIAELGLYECQWQLINTTWFLPQNRERIYLVGCLRDEPRRAVFPLNVPYEKQTLFVPKIEIAGAVTNSASQAVRIFRESRFSPTLMVGHGFTAGYLEVGNRVRRLTPLEGERLQGLPDNWTKYGIYNGKKKIITDGHRYEMIGNAVSRPIVTQIGKALLSGINPSLNGTPTSEISTLELESEALLLQFLFNQSSKSKRHDQRK